METSRNLFSKLSIEIIIVKNCQKKRGEEIGKENLDQMEGRRRSGRLSAMFQRSKPTKHPSSVIKIDLVSDSENGEDDIEGVEQIVEPVDKSAALIQQSEGDIVISDDDFQTPLARRLKMIVGPKNTNAVVNTGVPKKKTVIKDLNENKNEKKGQAKRDNNRGNAGGLPKNKNKVVDTICTRQSPSQLVRLFSSLGKIEQEVIREMGFGGILDCKVEFLPNKLGYWVVDHMDAMKAEIHIKNHIEKIDKKCVSDVLGFPMGEIKVECAQRCDIGSSEIIKERRMQFPAANRGPQRIYVKDVINKIKENKNGGKMFKLNVVVLIMTLMGEGIKCGTANFRILPCIKDVNDIPRMDWCGYVLEYLKRSKINWKRDDETCWYTGPLLFIVVWYATFVESLKGGNKSNVPFVTYWNTEKLREIETWSMNAYDVMQLILKRKKDGGAQTMVKSSSKHIKVKESKVNEAVSVTKKLTPGQEQMRVQSIKYNESNHDDASKNDDAIESEEDIIFLEEIGVIHDTCENGDNDTCENGENDKYDEGHESESNKVEDDGDTSVNDTNDYYNYSVEEFTRKIRSHYMTMVTTYYDLSELMFMGKYKHPDDADLGKLIAEVKEELSGYVDFDACVDINTPFPKEDKEEGMNVNDANNGNLVEETEETTLVHINLDQGEYATSYSQLYVVNTTICLFSI